MNRLPTLVLACLVSIFCMSLTAQVPSTSFAVGLAKAKTESHLLLVLAHGSDWCAFGERVMKAIWNDEKFREGLHARGAFAADVNVLQSPSAEQKQLNGGRNKGWKVGWVACYPSVVAFTSAGVLIGKLEGKNFPRSLNEARQAISAFASTCQTFIKLEAQYEKAKAVKDLGLQIEILLSIDQLSVPRPKNLVDRLKKLDPKDSLGHIARLTFPRWHDVVNKATVEAKGDKGQVARDRLNGWLARGVLTAEQQAVVHLALGNMCRYWKGHELEAAPSLERAIELSPKSTSGRAAKYLLNHVVSKSEGK